MSGLPTVAAGPRRCLLTFDVEDWFQTENLRCVFPRSSWQRLPRRVASATRFVLDALAAHDVQATFFVLGWVAEREPSLVREIADAGHEVACHGYGHVLPADLTDDEFRADLLRARRVLEDLSGQPVVGYRAPSFNINRDQLRVLAASGFRYDTSIHPFTLHDRYAQVDDLGDRLQPGVYELTGGLVELTLPVERWGPVQLPVGGGGYFRLFPSSLFRTLVRRLLTRQRHYLMYLHTWEFDPAQPRIRGAGLTRTFRHYNHLTATRPRLDRLIRMLQALGSRFVTARDFVDEILAPETPPTRAVVGAAGQ